MPYNIEIDAALPRCRAMTQQQVFDALAQRVFTETGFPKDLLIEGLTHKEQISISGIGNGVAIPQLKLRGLKQRFVILATLTHPVSFNAIDEKPADLICLILSPESHGGLHLRGLSRISRVLRNEELCHKLREARDEETMKSLFINPDGWLLAA